MAADDRRPVLILDAMNVFIRAWSAYPQLNVDGEPVGGSVGFLKTLRKLVYETQPRAVYVAFEGGGSQKRRAIYPEYKLGRRTERLNRFYGEDIPSTDENRHVQILSLLGFLKKLPVCQLYVSDCEGDDLVAYLCRVKFRDEPKVIASSDKDMYQLLDDKTRVYSLHKKTYVTSDDVFEEFRVTSEHFAIAKALVGDVSDNVPGVKGCGFKTVSTLFPLLGSASEVLLQDVIDYAASHVDESKMFKKIIDHEADIKRNYRLMFLDGGMLSAQQAARVDAAIAAHEPTIDRVGLLKLLIDAGIHDFDTEWLVYVFNCIEGVKHK